jgi:DNA-binding protein HU-beta
MNTAELIDRIAAENPELPRPQVRKIIEGALRLVTETAAAGDEVALSGFGRFKLADRAAREGRNPATGETIAIPASRKLVFTAAKAVRDQVNATPATRAAAE